LGHAQEAGRSREGRLAPRESSFLRAPEPARGLPLDALIPLLALNLGIVAFVMILVWMVSVRIRDVSIVDVAWGANGALIAILTFFLTDGVMPRRLLLTGMVTFWGVRLALHIALRKRGTGEDFRYAAMREAHGGAFPVRSLVTVFLLQAFLIWIITIPVQLGQRSEVPPVLTLLDLLGLGIWTLGWGMEVIADRQLRRFLADPSNRGRVMDRGLWRYSRHPNYFGESLVWWGVFLVAAATPGGWVTVFSPVLMTYLLVKVSGVSLLEKALTERRAGYREYMERTNPFIPWPRRDPEK
jgi:steroid 5-alpha reductase family enzyme